MSLPLQEFPKKKLSKKMPETQRVVTSVYSDAQVELFSPEEQIQAVDELLLREKTPQDIIIFLKRSGCSPKLCQNFFTTKSSVRINSHVITIFEEALRTYKALSKDRLTAETRPEGQGFTMVQLVRIAAQPTSPLYKLQLLKQCIPYFLNKCFSFEDITRYFICGEGIEALILKIKNNTELLVPPEALTLLRLPRLPRLPVLSEPLKDDFGLPEMGLLEPPIALLLVAPITSFLPAEPIPQPNVQALPPQPPKKKYLAMLSNKKKQSSESEKEKLDLQKTELLQAPTPQSPLPLQALLPPQPPEKQDPPVVTSTKRKQPSEPPILTSSEPNAKLLKLDDASMVSKSAVLKPTQMPCPLISSPTESLACAIEPLNQLLRKIKKPEAKTVDEDITAYLEDMHCSPAICSAFLNGKKRPRTREALGEIVEQMQLCCKRLPSDLGFTMRHIIAIAIQPDFPTLKLNLLIQYAEILVKEKGYSPDEVVSIFDKNNIMHKCENNIKSLPKKECALLESESISATKPNETATPFWNKRSLEPKSGDVEEIILCTSTIAVQMMA